MQILGKENNTDPNMQTIGSSNLHDNRAIANFDRGNFQDNISQIFAVDNNNDATKLSVLPRMDISY